MKALALVLTFSLVAGSVFAAEDAPRALKPVRFTTEAAVASAAQSTATKSFTPDASRPRFTKTKIAVIAAVAGAVVLGIVLTRNGGSKTNSPGGSPQPPGSSGPGGSILVINGVVQ